jgi:hypothetical protein
MSGWEAVTCCGPVNCSPVRSSHPFGVRGEQSLSGAVTATNPVGSSHIGAFTDGRAVTATNPGAPWGAVTTRCLSWGTQSRWRRFDPRGAVMSRSLYA